MKISNEKLKRKLRFVSKTLTLRIGLLCFFLILTACSSKTNDASVPSEPEITPTNHPYLNVTPLPTTSDDSNLDPDAIPTLSSVFDNKATVTLVPIATRPPFPTRAATPTAAENSFTYDLVYNEELNPNWDLNESWGVDFDMVDPSTIYTGTVAISVTPNEDFAALFFSVREDSDQDYLRQDLLGISFRVNSGSETLEPENMLVSVVGSNENYYWVKEDESVEPLPDTEKTFSETTLNFLGFNQPIPPDTWEEVIVWLDDLQFDPSYTYMTGFYIKTGEGYRNTYYIDNVALIYPKE